MVGVLLGVGESLLAAILYDAGRGAYRGFNSMLEAALNDTSDHFHGEGIEFNKDELREILREGNSGSPGKAGRFKQNGLFIEGDRLAGEFARLGKLYFPDRTFALEKSREIVRYFLERLEHYHLADPKKNAIILAAYLKQLGDASSTEHQGMIASLRRMERQIAGLVAVDKTKVARQTAIMRSNTLPEVTEGGIDWDPTWKPQMVVDNVQFEGEASPTELKPGGSVIVSFAKNPSHTWRDPKVASVALWDAKTRRAYQLPSSMWSDLESTKERRSKPGSAWRVWPLCIPSYDVSVEWRLESYCFCEPWGNAKEGVVRWFLRRCKGKNLECQVISLERAGQQWELLVQSADYDQSLHMEWPYYKGLESALSRGQYYKSEAIQLLKGAALKQFCHELSSNQKFIDLIPHRYRKQFLKRKIRAAEVSVMLAGIIKRERESRERWQLR